MKFDKNIGCSFLIWYFWKSVLSSFLLKSDKFLKHCIPEAFRKVPEDYPEAKPEGKNQYAKHRIPEGNRKVPEGFPEAEPEGKVVFFVFFYSFSC